ncbi:uncharacterized [Tachysurus ichikawai]
MFHFKFLRVLHSGSAGASLLHFISVRFSVYRFRPNDSQRKFFSVKVTISAESRTESPGIRRPWDPPALGSAGPEIRRPWDPPALGSAGPGIHRPWDPPARSVVFYWK